MPALVNILDVAPSLSGTVTGVTNGFSASAGFLVPIMVAATTGDDPGEVFGWRRAFMSGKVDYSLLLSFYHDYRSPIVVVVVVVIIIAVVVVVAISMLMYAHI